MRTIQRTIRLVGEDLTDQRHVCALVDGPGEAFDLLLPFVADGLAQGDRVFHVLDPRGREAFIERLGRSGIDVSAVIASHQLEVKTWDDAYMRGGRFDRSAQLAYLRRILAEGPELGYPVTRYIGSTEWAVDSDTVNDLMAYEARVDDLARRRSDVLVCTYDLNHHSPRTIADVLGVHSVAVVGGVLRSNREQVRRSARDRLLDAASVLFHERGIQATGVDALIAAAGVAKATFYRRFRSKDDLVVAWLRDPRTRWFDRVRAQAEGHGVEPFEVIPRFFDAVAEWLETDGYRGCPYLNTGVEITESTHPARPVVVDYLKEIEDYLFTLVAAAGYRKPRMLAAQLQMILTGSISLAAARRGAPRSQTARDAALSLLEEADRD
jgi:AcrR family transcriptional regulator